MRSADFYDVESVHAVYFDECAELVKRATGATAVLPFDHSVRNRLREGQGGISAPGESAPTPTQPPPLTLRSALSGSVAVAAGVHSLRGALRLAAPSQLAQPRAECAL